MGRGTCSHLRIRKPPHAQIRCSDTAEPAGDWRNGTLHDPGSYVIPPRLGVGSAAGARAQHRTRRTAAGHGTPPASVRQQRSDSIRAGPIARSDVRFAGDLDAKHVAKEIELGPTAARDVARHLVDGAVVFAKAECSIAVDDGLGQIAGSVLQDGERTDAINQGIVGRNQLGESLP